MSQDPLLPIAPATVKALVLPLGLIKADRFAAFVDLVQRQHVVPLRDVDADARPNRSKPTLPSIVTELMAQTCSPP